MPSLDDPTGASEASVDHALQLLKQLSEQHTEDAQLREELQQQVGQVAIRVGQVEATIDQLAADGRQRNAQQQAADAEATARFQRLLTAQVAAETTTARLERDMLAIQQLRDEIEAAASSSRRATAPQVIAAVIGALAATWHALSWIVGVLGIG